MSNGDRGSSLTLAGFAWRLLLALVVVLITYNPTHHSFLDWLRLEAIARRSDLTEEAAGQLAEEIKQGWWAANKDRFIKPAA